MGKVNREIPVADVSLIRGKALAPERVEHSLGDVVREVLGELSEEDRDLFAMVFHEQASLAEIATRLDRERGAMVETEDGLEPVEGLAGKTSAAVRVERLKRRVKEKLEARGVSYGE